MIDIKRILCPADFSEFSRRALDYAVALARWYNSTITVLHVATPAPAAAVAPYVGPEALQPFALTDVDRERLRRELRIFVAAEGAPGVAIDTRVEEGIDVHEEILVQAQRLASDLIVLGTHGRSGFQRLFLGSVAEKVLRKAVCPVMTVPRAVPDAVPAGPGLFRRILCPVDFSKSSAAALDYALSIAQEADATLTVLHSVEVLPDMTEPPFVMGLNMPELMEASRERVRAMIPDTARTYCRIEETVSVGKAWREILRIAGDDRTELIVIGVQGHGMLDTMMFGSTTQHVVRRATCPVLTLRPR